MTKRIFIMALVIAGCCFAQAEQNSVLPDITVESPMLVSVMNDKNHSSDWFIDTSQKMVIEPDYSMNHSLLGRLMNYFTSNLNYPDSLVYQRVEGNIYTIFNVDSSGHIVNIHQPKTVHPVLDNMIIKIMEECPPWPVKSVHTNASYQIKIRFLIRDE